MDKTEALKILAEYSKRINKPDFTAGLFKQQIDFINDPSKRKAVLASRRSGKSFMCAAYLWKTAYENPKSNSVYIGLTRESAKSIIWNYLLDINDKYKIGAEINLSNLTITLPNRSSIKILGADTPREIRKLLGRALHLAIVDEAGEFGSHLDSLVTEILAPTTVDYDGVLAMVSTPGLVCDGIFYKATTNKLPGWVSYKWTLLDNDYLPRPGWLKGNRIELLNEILKEDGVTKDSSTYRRMYCGDWVEDSSALVYHFSDRNIYSTRPDVDYFNIIALDFGITDESAIVIGSFSYNDTSMYVVETFSEPGMTPTVMAHKTKYYYDKYNPIMIVADGGGIGKAFIEQFVQMFAIPVTPSEKQDKVAFMTLLNDDIVAGNVKVNARCVEIIKHLKSYRWADPIAKDPGHSPDLLDALLYLWRGSRHYLGSIPVKAPSINDSNYADYEFERELERIEQQKNTPWWEQ